MKMKKKIIIFSLLFFIFSLGIFSLNDIFKKSISNEDEPNLSYQEFESTALDVVSIEYGFSQVVIDGYNLLYQITEGFEVEVTKFINSKDSSISNLSIPSYIKDNNGIVYKVVGIGDYAFSSDELKGIIKNTINLPTTLLYIGEGAFKGLTGVTAIKYEGTELSEIGKSAFESTQIKEFNLTEKITVLKERVFYETQLQSIKVPNSVELIEKDAFSKSTLKVINLGTGIKKINEYAFDCSNLSFVYFQGSAPVCGENIFGTKENVVIYRELTATGWNYDDDYLSSKGEYVVNKTDENCIYYEIRVSEFNILDFVDVDENEKTFNSKDYQGVEYKLDKSSGNPSEYTALVVGFKDVTKKNIFIPDEVIYDGDTYKITSIASDLIGNEILEKVVLDANIKLVNSQAFDNCPNLKSVCFIASEATVNGKIFNDSITDYEIVGTNVNVTGVTNLEKEEITKHIYKALAVEQEVHTDAQGIFYSILSNENGEYAVVGTSYDGDDEKANTSKYVGSGEVSGEMGYAYIPDYIFIGNDFYKVRSIGRYSFYNNQSLNYIRFGAFIGEEEDSNETLFAGIWDCSLRNCSNLKGFEVDERNKSLVASNLNSGTGTPYLFLCEKDKNLGVVTKIIKASTDINSFDISGNGSIKTIESYAFSNCYRLFELNLYDAVNNYGVEKIGKHAFENTPIGMNGSTTTLDFTKINNVGEYAFQNCQYIKKVINIGDLDNFGRFVFRNCSNLESFTTKAENEKYLTYDNVLYEKRLDEKGYAYLVLLQFPAQKKVESLVINYIGGFPVRIIEAYAFAYSQLSNVTFGDSVYIVGKEAFANSNKLTKVVVGKNVTYLGMEVLLPDNAVIADDKKDATYLQALTKAMEEGNQRIEFVDVYEQEAFDNCYALVNFEVSEENNHYLNDTNGILYNKNKTTLLLYPQGNSRLTFTIPSTVTKIALEAFENNTHIQRIIVPEGVTEVGAKAFNGCTNLSSIYFRTLQAPNIYEQVFNSAGANVNGLTIYCIQQPAKWYEGKEVVWANYNVEKYNAIQDITNDVTTTDPIYMLFVSDADGNGIKELSITVTTASGKERKTITDENGYAFFSIPSQDALNDDCTVKLVIKDLNNVFYDYINNDFLLDLNTSFSNVSLTAVPTVNGQKYEEYYYSELWNQDIITRKEDISSSVIFVNKISLARTTALGLPNRDLITSKLDYLCKMLFTVKCSFDSKTTPIRLSIWQSGKEVLFYDFIDPTNHTKLGSFKYDPEDGTVTFDEFDIDVFGNDDANKISIRFDFKSNGEEKYVVNDLNIKVFEYEYDVDYFFSLMQIGKYEYTFDPDIPLIGGTEISIEVEEMTKFNCSSYYEEDRYIFGLNLEHEFSLLPKNENYSPDKPYTGVQRDESWESYSDVKTALSAIHNYNKLNEKEKEHLGEYVNEKSITLELSGAIEIQIDGLHGNNRITEGTLIGTITYKFEISRTYVVWVIPVNVTAELTAKGELQLTWTNMSIEEEKEQNLFEMQPATLTLEVGIKLSGGVGCRLASVGMYGYAGIECVIEISKNFGVTEINGKFDFGVYLKAKIGFVKIEAEKSLCPDKWKSVKIYARNDGKQIKYAIRTVDGGEKEYDSLVALSNDVINDVDNTLVASDSDYSSYGNKEPKVVTYNGKTYKFYLDNIYANPYYSNKIATNYNYLKLVYSELQVDGTWSNPIIVNSTDNFNEIEFDVTADQNGIHILYTKAIESMSSETAQYFTSKLSIVYTLFDGGCFSHKVLSTSKYYQYNLEIAAIDNDIYASWLENKDNSLYGTSNILNEDNTMENTTANSIHIYKKEAGQWSKVVEQFDLGLMIDQELTMINGEVYYAFIYDNDGNLPTIEDRYVYLINLDSESKEIIKAEINYKDAFYGSGFEIYNIAESNGNLYIQNESYIYQIQYNKVANTIKLEEVVAGIYSDYEFIYDDKNNITSVIYLLNESEIINEGTEDERSIDRTNLVISIYNQEKGFLNPVKITDYDYGKYVNYFEIYEYNSQKYVLINQSDISVVDGNEVISYVDKYQELETESDVIFEQLIFNTSNIVSNEEFSVTIQLTNNSTKVITDAYVDLMKDGKIITTALVQTNILPGMTGNFEAKMSLVTVEKEYDVRVRTNIEEENMSNNVITTQFAFPDIMVNVKSISMGGIKYLLVFVQNVGSLPSDSGKLYIANGSVQPFDKNEGVTGIDQEEIDYLYTLPYDSLQSLEYKYYTIELNKVYFTDSLVTIYAISDSESEQVIDNNVSYFTIDENQIVSGVGTYKITYHVEGLETGNETYVQEYEVGEVIEALDYIVYEGYDFKGWYNLPTIMPNRNIDVYGIYELQYYEVIYQVVYENNNTEVYRDTYEYNANINFRNIYQEGYAFTEWKEYDFINDKYLEAPTTMPSHSIILISEKSKLSYNINYYVNGIKEERVDSLSYNKQINREDLLNISVEGYTFSGWNDVPSRMPATDINLYATLTKNNYYIYYNLDRTEVDNLLGNGFEINIKNQEMVQYEANINLNAPNVLGFTFSGWYCDEALNTKFDLQKMPANNINLYAKYEPITYKLSYVVEGKTVKTENYYYNQKIEDYNHIVDGKTIEWINLPVTGKMPANDYVIYSTSTKNLFDVEYYVDGNILYTDKCQYDSVVNLRPEEVKEGYKFICWYSDSEFSVKYEPTKMKNETLKLYGKFEAIDYTLRYIVNGEVVNTEKHKFGDIISLYSYNPENGYRVSEWSENITTMPARNVDLYALTLVNLYSLKYYVDNKLVLETYYAYNDMIVPYLYTPLEGYSISSWSGLTVFMPNNNLEVYATSSKIDYTITYYINGKIDKTVQYKFGDQVESYVYQTATGTLFLGFIDEPTIMPANNINVYGYTSEMIFTVSYFVDEELMFTDSYCYGANIIERGNLIKEGYSFSGWSEIPETMPNNNLVVMGTFVPIDYKIFYYVNNELFNVQTYNYMDTINPLDNLSVEGYSFSGWTEIPATMPAHDLIINSSLLINNYKINYYINNELYKVETYSFNEEVSLEQLSEKDFSGWMYNDEIVETIIMPSKDINLYATVTEQVNNGVVVAASSAGTLTLAGAIFLVIKVLRPRKKGLLNIRA